MKSLTRYMFIVFALIAAVSGKASGKIQVLAQVDTSKDIYVGESFAYHIIIDGDNKPGEVDITPLAKYDARSAGNRDVSQRSWTFVNGKTTQNIVKRYVMSYSLTARQSGRIELPPVRVTVGGKTYQTDMVQVNVLKPGRTDKLDLEVTLSEQQCYVGQPVIMTVKFYFSADVSDTQFNIPVFSSNAFYFENPDVFSRQEKEYDLGAGVTVLVSRHRTVHKDKDCNLIVLRKVLIPKIAGQIKVEPATVSTNVAVGRARGGFWGRRFEYKRFMVSSKLLTLTVLPLPTAGKPPGFYGLVGRYTISASATPTSINVGDPITLTVKIGGSKYLKPVQWPALEQVPEVAANFKIPSQRSSPTIQNGFKVFTQTIRANNDKVTSIPPIPLAFFDADNGKYLVAKTKPIKLEVAPTKILTGQDLEGRDFTPVNKEVEAIRKGLSANYEGLDVLRNQSFSPLTAVLSPGYAVLWAVPFATLVLSFLVKFFTHTSPEKVALRRKRSALSRVVRQLKKVASAGPQQRPELLASTMKQYIGERFDRMAGSLTADDCYEIILTAAEDAQTAEKYRETIARCEAARYAWREVNVDRAQIKEVIKLVRDIEKMSKK